jgi:hypothetical protein
LLKLSAHSLQLTASFVEDRDDRLLLSALSFPLLPSVSCQLIAESSLSFLLSAFCFKLSPLSSPFNFYGK